ncbi:MAG: thioredoxin family protein [Anaerolineales bacterium]|jgi:alkyl hydroperoxide reductase subunit AhpF
MAEKLLGEEVIVQVQEVFNGLVEPVEVLFFGQKDDCEYCDDTLQLAQELVDLSDILSLSIYDLDDDAEIAEKYNVDKAPGLVLAAVEGGEIVDYGVRFAGIPSGHEFSSLVHDLTLISTRDSGLGEETRRYLAGLTEPLLLQVFVTPT